VHPPSFPRDLHPRSSGPRGPRPGMGVGRAGLPPATIGGLRQRGHLVEVADHWSLGRTCAAGRDPATGFLVAAANPRGRQAYAVGR
ncbi:MAG: gamma-glutamyltransferase family protein, partial [Actinomycetota bacterium]